MSWAAPSSRQAAIVIGLGLCVLFAATAAQSTNVQAKVPFDHAQLARTSLEQFIRPGYARFGEAVGRMSDRVAELCSAPSENTLKAARESFRKTVAAWGGVEFITFGPVGENNRLERIMFWPDRRGIGARQVRRLIYAKKKRALDPARLAKMSVAMQGLGALEIALYSKGAGELAQPGAATFRCGYALAVSRNLGAIAKAILTSWASSGAFAKLWLTAGPGNTVYLSGRETTLELSKLLNQGLDTVVEQRLEPLAGIGARKVRRPVILARSGLTLNLVAADVAALKRLMFDGGIVTAVAARAGNDEEALSLMRSVRAETDLAVRLLKPLAQGADLLGKPGSDRKLVPTIFALKNIRENAVGLLKSSAGLSLGFNASDGD
jgi:uncharacterized protein